MATFFPYADERIQDILRRRAIMAPPITCHNRISRVSHDFIQKRTKEEIEEWFRKKGFWGKRCEDGLYSVDDE
jgi:hypothetical protein